MTNKVDGGTMEPWLTGLKKISARQVKALPVGTAVELHYRNAHGQHCAIRGRIIRELGLYKVFSFWDPDKKAASALPICEYGGKVWTIDEKEGQKWR